MPTTRTYTRTYSKPYEVWVGNSKKVGILGEGHWDESGQLEYERCYVNGKSADESNCRE